MKIPVALLLFAFGCVAAAFSQELVTEQPKAKRRRATGIFMNASM